MPGPDLDAVLGRSGRAWHHIRGRDHMLSADLRTHFQVDVPALVDEIRFLRNVIDRMNGGGATEPGPAA
jgi:hypothetical protein